MPVRLVALDEGPDIPVDRPMVVVGRHPQCDARLDSIRVSRRHCCMTAENGEVVVRDLGSTNGIRINGQRVEMGRLRPGDELSIAHIRFKLDTSEEPDRTLADSLGGVVGSKRAKTDASAVSGSFRVHPFPAARKAEMGDNALAAAVRELLPASVANRCRIQVILHMDPESDASPGPDSSDPPAVVAEEGADACRRD